MGKGKEKLVSFILSIYLIGFQGLLRTGSTIIFYGCLIFLIIFLPVLTNEMETVKEEYVQSINLLYFLLYYFALASDPGTAPSQGTTLTPSTHDPSATKPASGAQYNINVLQYFFALHVKVGYSL